MAAFWLGAFWPLRAMLAEQEARAAPAVRRFSTLALPAVVLLLAAGAAVAAVHLRGDPAALVTSDYGALVLTKLACVAVLLLLAAANRQRLTPALAAGRSGAAAWLSRSIGAEALIAAVVLGVTAVLTGTPPPARSVVQEPVATANTQAGHSDHHTKHHAHHAFLTAAGERGSIMVPAGTTGGVTALLTVSPGRVGRNRMMVTLERTDGMLVAPLEVWIELAKETAGVAPIRRQLRPEGGGFTYEGPELALPGRWTMRIEALISDFDLLIWTAGIEVRDPAAR
jgi:copper transport protein